MRSVADDGGDGVRPVMQVQHDVRDALTGEVRQHSLDERRLADRNRRLGDEPRDGIKAGAEASCQDERGKHASDSNEKGRGCHAGSPCLMNARPSGPLDHWTLGPLDPWTLGPLPISS